MPTVAIYDDYLASFSRLPRTQQRKLREFNRKFVAWPRSDSWRLERPAGMRDPAVHTVRVAPETSAVVLHPGESDLYVMLWAGRPEEALDWAKELSFTVHERTGAIQVYDYVRLGTYLKRMQSASAVPLGEEESGGRKTVRATLKSTTDDELLSLGVPRILLPAVRALGSRKDLDELGRYLPAEAAEALLRLAAGFSPEELAVPAAGRDAGDYRTALDHPDSRRRFAVVRAAGDLEAMLNAPLEKWRLFLHPSQDALVARNFDGPVRILGGAGTGKTVVAMHRARHLARAVFPAPTDRVLFTTFTTNLAQNLRDLMQSFCGDELQRIEVLNLHAWATQYARSNGLGVDSSDESEGEPGRSKWTELMRVVRAHVEARTGGALYRAAVVDETQDFASRWSCRGSG
ncbi:MAG: AAA family ATPase [Candidatus Wallbacteria bacterium]|nr:AAA family ATPase [Candidatus Wallbacteria bacterium]